MKEVLEFLDKKRQEDFDIVEWVFDFIGKHSNISQNDYKYIAYEIDNIFKTLKDTYFKGAFADNDAGDSLWSDIVGTISPYLCMLSDKLSIHPDKMIDEYTPEMLEYYTEGVIYNINEQTEEWRKKNKSRSAKKKIESMTTDEKKKLDDLFSKIPD